MKQLNVKIELVQKLKPDIYRVGFKSGYIAKNAKPGQFLHIKVDEAVTILRRPLSIHRVSKDAVSILFKVRGRGTQILSQYKKGDTLDIIGPLGKGFTIKGRSLPTSQAGTMPAYRSGRDDGRSILVAGGMGVAPLVFLGEKLKEIYRQAGKIKNVVLLGARNKNEVLAEKEFKKLGFEISIATDDGSRGFKGTVTALLKKILAMRYAPCAMQIYACGPKEMFLAIKKITESYPTIECQVSFEQCMGCGLGICCGCVIETKNGYKKVCKDGPVFDLKEIP